MSNTDSLSMTSSELGYLWTGYAINEMSQWYLILFHEHANDEEVKNLFSFALKSTDELLKKRKILLTDEGFQIPIGFTQNDLDTSSPSLFSDRFSLYYLHEGARLGLDFHTKALSLATRQEIRNYHKECVTFAIQLQEKVVELLLIKGFYWRTPALPAPDFPEKVHKSSYLAGWVGDTRPLNSIEIANLYLALEILIMIETLCLGFAQTTDSEEIVDLFHKAEKIVKSQYHSLVELVKEEELPIPPSYINEVTDSKKRVLSDRIMVCHLVGLFGSLLSQYGFSLGSVMKHDLLKTYSTLIAEAGIFSEKTTRFMIKKEWLEKVPGAMAKKN